MPTTVGCTPRSLPTRLERVPADLPAGEVHQLDGRLVGRRRSLVRCAEVRRRSSEPIGPPLVVRSGEPRKDHAMRPRPTSCSRSRPLDGRATSALRAAPRGCGSSGGPVAQRLRSLGGELARLGQVSSWPSRRRRRGTRRSARRCSLASRSLVCTPRVAARLPLVASSQPSSAASSSSMRLVVYSMIWMNDIGPPLPLRAP